MRCSRCLLGTRGTSVPAFSYRKKHHHRRQCKSTDSEPTHALRRRLHPQAPARSISQSLQVVSTWLRPWYEVIVSESLPGSPMLPRPPWNDTISFYSGIHPHLSQRRGDASLLPSPVAAVADGCTVPVTRSALALGAAHARLSAVPQSPRYSSRPGGWNLRCRRGTAIWATFHLYSNPMRPGFPVSLFTVFVTPMPSQDSETCLGFRYTFRDF